MQVFHVLLNVVGPVVLVAFTGWLWAMRKQSFDAGFVGALVNNIATPCLIVDTLLRTGVQPAALSTMGVAAFATIALTLAASWLMILAAGQQVRTFLPSMTWSNAGNIGLPLSLFAFGAEGLSLAIAFFTISSLTNYTIGQGISAGGLSFAQLLRMPIVYAIAIALTLIGTGWQLPQFAGRAVQLMGGVAVPLMLFSLGYSLATLKIASLRLSLVFALARLLGGFAIGWAVALLLGLEGVARGVVVIQSAMPAAVLNYLFALRYNNDPQEVAGVVVLSTLLAVLLLPLFLLSVM